MYKLLCSDLDGTLVNWRNRISKKDRKHIQIAHQMGLKFVITTARSEYTVGSITDGLKLTGSINDYIISLNGGVISNLGTGEKIAVSAIPYELANDLYKFGRAQDFLVQIFTDQRTYLTNNHPSLIGHLLPKDFKSSYKMIYSSDLSFVKLGENIIKVSFFAFNPDKLRKIQMMHPEVFNYFDSSFSSLFTLDFTAHGVNKGLGLKTLSDHLNIDLANTIAIGNDYNDISMIELAGLGIAVKNAKEGVKEAADYVTERSYNQSAITEVIEKFIL